MKYSCVIFDLDGTILDTLEDLHASVTAAMDAFSMQRRSLAEVRSFVGNGIRRLMELSVPKETPVETIDLVQQVFSGHYKLHCNDRTRPYDGIPELIRELRERGCQTAVVSNKDDYAVRELCELHFPGLFDTVVGCRESVRKKPAPDSVIEVLSRLGASREDAVYIGDSEVDLQTARNAGLALITVSWGFRDEAQLRQIGCKDIATSVAQLRQRLIDEALIVPSEKSIVERRICSKDFPYLQPYFYSSPHALRCELGIGDDNEAYMNAARSRAVAIYDLLFPKGADAVIFNYWIYDHSDSGEAESLCCDENDDAEAAIRFAVEQESEQLRFLLEYQRRYRHLSLNGLPTSMEAAEGDPDRLRRNRIVCFSDGKGFDHRDLIDRQVNQHGDHEIGFVSFEHECILSIYDDRGCDVVFMTMEKMKELYPKLEPYFLDYDREEMLRRYNE